MMAPRRYSCSFISMVNTMRFSTRARKLDRWDWMRRNYIYLLGLLALVISALVAALVIAHFQFGLDLWWISIKHPETAQYWGQLGDFIGGILNPLLSFCALIAVLYNLSLQREELSLAREDAREVQDIQNKQSAIFKQQNFESVFFRLLDMHSSLSRNMRIKLGYGPNARVYEGEDAFRYLSNYYIGKLDLVPHSLVPVESQIERVRDSSQGFLDAYVGSVGHYYRNIYQILKYVDAFGSASFGSSKKSLAGMEVRRALRSYRSQRNYANMLRAQLSSSEVACLFLNCLATQGDGLKFYVEKYSMLKTLEPSVIGGNRDISNLFNKLAYADYEDMEMVDVVSLIRSRYLDDTDGQG
ncbi:putative phage abortive infection protein [Pseudomonas sp. MPB26]|uniref:putative phage abortive infection protein n=1 Tax=Pseudomonas sp. MPB26 TaxID=3388491 RepID=UPI003984B8AB